MMRPQVLATVLLVGSVLFLAGMTITFVWLWELDIQIVGLELAGLGLAAVVAVLVLFLRRRPTAAEWASEMEHLQTTQRFVSVLLAAVGLIFLAGLVTGYLVPAPWRPLGSILMAAAMLLFLIGLLIHRLGLGARRQAALVALAAKMGLRFYPWADAKFLAELPECMLRRRGTRPSAGDLLEGEWGGTRLVIFDYLYQDFLRNQLVRQARTVAYLPDDSGLPIFWLGAKHTPAEAIPGLVEIDMAGAEAADFAAAYSLRGELEYAVREVFGEQLVQFFATNKGWCVESTEGGLLVYRPDRPLRPDEFEELLVRACIVHQALTAARSGDQAEE